MDFCLDNLGLKKLGNLFSHNSLSNINKCVMDFCLDNLGLKELGNYVYVFGYPSHYKRFTSP